MEFHSLELLLSISLAKDYAAWCVRGTCANVPHMIIQMILQILMQYVVTLQPQVSCVTWDWMRDAMLQ